MEIEPSPPVIDDKLWNTVRTVFYMLRKGISKSKLLIDLHMLLKRSNKVAGKALSSLLLHHHHYSASFACRSGDDVAMSFVGPREYEFSCSNTPLYIPYYSSKRKNHTHRYNIRHRGHFYKDNGYYDDVNVVQKVFDILNNNYDTAAEASPLALPGFGKSPAAGVRQLRITDSPFPLKDNEEEDAVAAAQVEKAADEFINKFYKELRRQRGTVALESPSPYHCGPGDHRPAMLNFR